MHEVVQLEVIDDDEGTSRQELTVRDDHRWLEDGSRQHVRWERRPGGTTVRLARITIGSDEMTDPS